MEWRRSNLRIRNLVWLDLMFSLRGEKKLTFKLSLLVSYVMCNHVSGILVIIKLRVSDKVFSNCKKSVWEDQLKMVKCRKLLSSFFLSCTNLFSIDISSHDSSLQNVCAKKRCPATCHSERF